MSSPKCELPGPVGMPSIEIMSTANGVIVRATVYGRDRGTIESPTATAVFTDPDLFGAWMRAHLVEILARGTDGSRE